MAKGFSGMPGNMNNLMKQAQKMQKQMQEMQEAQETNEYNVTAGGGAIKITILGTKEIKNIEISKEVVDPDDIEMLQDLILTAVNEAIRQVEEASSNEMKKMGLPGGMF